MKCYLYLPLLLLSACASTTEEASAPRVTAAMPSPVRLDTARVQAFEFRIEAKGLVQAGQAVSIQFQQGGVLEAVPVQNGQAVAKGQLLGQLETSLLQIAFEKAQQDLALRRDDYLLALRERTGAGGDTSSLSEGLRRTFLAQTGFGHAQLAYREAKIRLAQATLYAPFSGTIANLSAKPGDQANLSQPFCLLYNPDALEVEAQLLESDFAALRTGLIAEIWPLGQEKPVQAVLQRVNPHVNAQGLFSAYFRLSQSKGLLPGMHASVRVRIPAGNALLVPKEAVIMRSGKAVVFTEEGKKAKWNYVQTGRDNGLYIEIIEGLQPNARIIVSNNLQLAHDAPVSY
jgi:RND family efflux transporter MFP subunit